METLVIKLIAPTSDHVEFWKELRECASAKKYMPLLDMRTEDLAVRLEKSTASYGCDTEAERLFIMVDHGSAVGIIGCKNISPLMQYGEINYMVAPSCRGRGIAKMAVHIFTTRLFAHGFRKLGAIVDARNLASKKVVERTGFRLEGILREHFSIQGTFRDQCIYGLFAHEACSPENAIA